MSPDISFCFYISRWFLCVSKLEFFSSKCVYGLAVAEAWIPLRFRTIQILIQNYWIRICDPMRFVCPVKSEKVKFLEKRTTDRHPCGVPRALRSLRRGRGSWVLITSTNGSTKSPSSHLPCPLMPEWSFLNSDLVLLFYTYSGKSKTLIMGSNHYPSTSPIYCPLLVCQNSHTPTPSIHTLLALPILLLWLEFSLIPGPQLTSPSCRTKELLSLHKNQLKFLLLYCNPLERIRHFLLCFPTNSPTTVQIVILYLFNSSNSTWRRLVPGHPPTPLQTRRALLFAYNLPASFQILFQLSVIFSSIVASNSLWPHGL